VEGFFLLFFVLIFCLVIGGIIYSIYAAKKRREDLARLAAQLGLRFNADDPFDIPETYSSFDWLSKGHGQEAYNVLHGRMGRWHVKAFDYVYKTTESSTDSQGHSNSREVSHYFSAVIVDTDASFRPLMIRPETFMDKLAAAVGFDDIDFESAEFSKTYYVQSSDKKFAYDVIHPRMMEFLLQDQRWTIQLDGSSVMATQGSWLEVDEYREALQLADSFLKLLPEYLWEQMRTSQ
jgi:hypothetical protein